MEAMNNNKNGMNVIENEVQVTEESRKASTHTGEA